MAKILRRNGFYIIRSQCPKEVFDEQIEELLFSGVTIGHAHPSGSTISVPMELATDARLAFLFKVVCEIEEIRRKL